MEPVWAICRTRRRGSKRVAMYSPNTLKEFPEKFYTTICAALPCALRVNQTQYTMISAALPCVLGANQAQIMTTVMQKLCAEFPMTSSVPVVMKVTQKLITTYIKKDYKDMICAALACVPRANRTQTCKRKTSRVESSRIKH